MPALPFRSLLCALVLAGALAAAEPAPSPWPLDIPDAKGVITLYQPQPEKLAGNVLTGRAAASYLAAGKGEDERVFGALWFTATLDIDREHEVARARTFTITKVVTPQGEKAADEGAAAKAAIRDAVLAKGIEIDLDRLAATLEEPAQDAAPAFDARPPRILIREQPALLVLIDGDPQLKSVDGVQRVVNSPSFLAVDEDGAWWLRAERAWLTAASLDGPWSVPTTVPVAAIVAAATKAGFDTAITAAPKAAVPAVVIAREPSELVVFDGRPAFAPIGDGALLGATNTASTALVEVATGAHWLLLAGRWFRAARLDERAEWTLVPPDRLPAAFARIPLDGEWSPLRAHVAGTPEAEEEAAHLQVPQTARIPRSATITVAFDGDPQWERVSGLEVEFARNSADAVFRLPGPQFYACRDGVWYQAADPLGAFAVAATVPEALHRLPADCPWHACSYVQVYESDPDWVWCGYTPGYLGWYTWNGCPVYGTGHWYHGWYGAACYPRPVTWGVGIAWNSSHGWAVAVGGNDHWAVGVSVHSRTVGWWGSGGVNGVRVTRTTVTVRHADAWPPRPGPDHRIIPPVVYDRVPGAERPHLQEAGARLRPAGPQPAAGIQPQRENLAVDRDGTIGRPTRDGSWQVRDQGTWKARPASAPAQPAARPAAAAPRPAAATPQPVQPRPQPSFERTQELRQRGEQRVQQRSPAAPQHGGRR